MCGPAVYCYIIFFSNLAPGAPGYTPPEGTFRELFHESINYFYINIFLNWANLPGIPTNAVCIALLLLLGCCKSPLGVVRWALACVS